MLLSILQIIKIEIHVGHTHTPVDHEANHITRGTPE